MLAGAGLGDDPRLAHPLGEQALAERVVELVRARVHQVLALEPDRAAGRLGQALGVVERRRAAAEVALQAGELGAVAGVLARDEPGRLELGQRRHQRLGDVLAAVRAEAVLDLDAHGAASHRCRRGREERRELVRVLDPRRGPRRPRRRRPRTGSTAAIPAATFSGSSPPERIAGTIRRRRAASAQSQVCPVPPRRPRAAVSSRWKSVWKRSRSWKSEASAMRIALMILAPVRRATSPQNAGPSSPWSWTCESCSASAARRSPRGSR